MEARYIFIKKCVVLIENAYILCVENHDFANKIQENAKKLIRTYAVHLKTSIGCCRNSIFSIGRRGFLGTIVPELHDMQYFLKVRTLFADICTILHTRNQSFSCISLRVRRPRPSACCLSDPLARASFTKLPLLQHTDPSAKIRSFFPSSCAMTLNGSYSYN